MMQIYVQNSELALELYQNAFDEKILCDHRHENGTVAHAEIDIFGQVFAICETQENEVISGMLCNFACISAKEKKIS
jgi:uncharacterized glyoxalase superfamily protein PhnB